MNHENKKRPHSVRCEALFNIWRKCMGIEWAP